MAATIEELIERTRDGGSLAPDEMERLILGYARGDVPDYQMSAWLMAAFLRGLTPAETAAMTDAMVRSGRVIDLGSIPGVKVDKHSTGGVADTTTLALAPLVAALGVPVAKMSGRGLGHTGGTLDKLESIPGYRVELSAEEFLTQVQRIGIAVIAQSPDIDPADKKIYALRDVTATVPSIPLIVGSIISKKVAGGADAILLDVKVGSGAFMKTDADAQALASELVRVGRLLGKDVHVVLSDMDQPLGNAVGNALEVIEAVEVLRGEGPADLSEVCVELAARMLVLGGVADDVGAGRSLASHAIENGSALAKMKEWFAAQGGDPTVVEDTSRLARSARSRDVRAVEGGFVEGFDAEGVGRAAMALGAGRERAGDPIDHGAGLVLSARRGDAVSPGDVLATLWAADDVRLDAGEERFRAAIRVGSGRPEVRPLLRDGEV